MKKLTKKHIAFIVIVAVLALTITGVAIGMKGNQKNNDKKVETVEKEKEEKKEEKEGVEETEVEVPEQTEEVVEETATTAQKNETPNQNTTTNKTTTTNKSATTKPSQSVTQPTPSHVHIWTEVKETVTVPETGHYETIFEQKSVCDVCQTDITGFSWDERSAHFKKEPCKGGTYTTSRVEAGQNWIVDTPATTEARVTGYKCSCGATREKTQYAGMYSVKDRASWDALERCKTVFRNGLAGEGSTFYETSAEYGYWESVVV